jgi:dimethylargininase
MDLQSNLQSEVCNLQSRSMITLMPKSVAITRAVSPALAACELTHLPRVPIDVARARAQHRAYEEVLIDAGYLVERLDTSPQMPDSVFVEDIAIVFDEIAIITRPGAESRRRETAAVAETLGAYRPLRAIQHPGTVDGGDVLVAGRRVFVGRSSRTNEAAVRQMRQVLEPLGYTVTDTVVHFCLHLKSAVTALSDDVLLANREWIDPAVFEGFTLVEVDPSEPNAANALRLDDRIVYSSAFPRTAERITRRGLRVQAVDASEVAKAEGAVTCCSLIVAGH